MRQCFSYISVIYLFFLFIFALCFLLFALTFYFHILNILPYRQGHIPGQSPWRCGPCQKISIAFCVFASIIYFFFLFIFTLYYLLFALLLQLELHINRNIFYILVPLRHLKVRQRRFAMRTDLHGFEAFIDKAFFVQFFEGPP